MALFGRKKEIVPLPPIAQWEYRCGDGHHWGFHYRVAEEQDHVRLTYSRTMPEHLESIAAPAVLWQQLSELGDRYHITAWAGYNECRLRTPRTKRWLLYITFADGTSLRAEGCGAAPKGHEQWENDLLALLNSYFEYDLHFLPRREPPHWPPINQKAPRMPAEEPHFLFCQCQPVYLGVAHKGGGTIQHQHIGNAFLLHQLT